MHLHFHNLHCHCLLFQNDYVRDLFVHFDQVFRLKAMSCALRFREFVFEQDADNFDEDLHI